MRGLVSCFLIMTGAGALGCGGSVAADAGTDAGPESGDAASAGGTPADGLPPAAPGIDGSGAASAGDVVASVAGCRDFTPLKNVYFGDLHTHTSYSFDAYAAGTRNDPAAAYAFARGEGSIVIASGRPRQTGPTVKIDRPLNFLAVTDHSEFLGESVKTATPWQDEQRATAAANDPCRFTSFNAYEWSSSPGGVMHHRNVVFDGDKVPPAPLSSLKYTSPQALWTGLAAACAEAGCDVITIPHNSNKSHGEIFDTTGFTAGDLANMVRFQRVAEIFQHKGASECLSDPQDVGYDPYCNFELLSDSVAARDKPAYLRSILGRGLASHAAGGTNLFQMGFVGATDTHNATPGNVNEATWPGHIGAVDNSAAERIKAPSARGPGNLDILADYNPGGLSGVWAEENTRERLFAAFKRRETYATSGPRIVVRFFQSWTAGDPCLDPGFPAPLMRDGAVPMGGTMTADASRKPRFVVAALKDQVNLARVDIVRATLAGAELKEQVQPIFQGDAPTVCASWVDEDYDSRAPAFYYARVMEVPTQRWSAYDCLQAPSANPVGCRNGTLNRQIQERAWTSPIWNLP